MIQATLGQSAIGTFTSRMRAHFAIMRLDHSVKQIFVVPGFVVAATLTGIPIHVNLILRMVAALVAVSAIASSNYVLNEMLDAPYDRLHPTKQFRPAACGRVHHPLGYFQWLLLGSIGLLLAHFISTGLMLSLLALWIMGCIYNISPLRSKDVAYLDVLSESINNPLRFCAGWYVVTAIMVPPVSLLLSYWMLGAYFMALKRFSEYRESGPLLAGSYRRSFQFYTEKSLLNSVVFYAAAAMLFFGAFCMRYRMELVLAFPVIALLMAVYFDLAFEPDSAVQHPEKLFREPRLMILLTVCIALLVALLAVRLPWLAQMFPKSVAP